MPGHFLWLRQTEEEKQGRSDIGEHAAIPELMRRIGELGIAYKDLNTRQSSLEDIFVGLVSERA